MSQLGIGDNVIVDLGLGDEDLLGLLRLGRDVNYLSLLPEGHNIKGRLMVGCVCLGDIGQLE